MEYELSFLNFDYKKIKQKIKKLNGIKVHSFVAYDVAYFYLANKNNFSSGFIRVRNENNIIKLTTKILSSKYPEEYETVVNTSYDDILKLLENSGLICKIKTIKYREKWTFPGCHEVVFDIWPGLPIILEVDCTSEELLKKSCEKLDLDIHQGFTQSKYDVVLGIPNKITNAIPNLNFSNFKKLLKNHVKKNKTLFNSLNNKYYKTYIKNFI